MTMGLILLGIMALLLLFSFGRNAFSGMGLPAWAAFLAVAAFAVGIIVPTIRTNGEFFISVGGFILPVAAMFALLVPVARGNAVLRAVAGMLAVVAITVGLLLAIPTYNVWMSMLASWAIGLIAGAVAFLVSRSRSACAFAVLGGVAVGDLIYCLLEYFAFDSGAITLGGATAYNAMFVGVLFALILAEVAALLGRSGAHGTSSRRSMDFEASKDERGENGEGDDFDRFDDDLFK